MTTIGPFVFLIALNAVVIVKLCLKVSSPENVTQASVDVKSTSIMLVARCISFVCCNIPICVMMVSPWWDEAYYASDWPAVADCNFVWALSHFLVYLDHSINFLVFVGIPKFRREFVRMCQCRKETHSGELPETPPPSLSSSGKAHPENVSHS